MLRPPTPLESQMMLLGCGGSGGASFVGPLDDYTSNLRVAHSVARRLLSSYTGPLFRVRSSAGGEQDIGYGLDGWADTAALASFIGANSGFVTIIYDQSGGVYHQRQTTAAAQMRIVGSGTNDTLGGRLCLYNSSGGINVGYYGDTFTTYTGATLSGFSRCLSAAWPYYREASVVFDATDDFDNLGRAMLLCTGATTGLWTSFRNLVLVHLASINSPSSADSLISSIYDGADFTIRDGTNTAAASVEAAWNINRLLWGMFNAASPYTAINAKRSETFLWTSDQTSNQAAIRAALSY